MPQEFFEHNSSSSHREYSFLAKSAGALFIIVICLHCPEELSLWNSRSHFWKGVSSLIPNNRKALIAGNWKMYKTIAETEAFFTEVAPLVKGVTHCEVVIAPPFTALRRAAELAESVGISIGAQDLHWEKEGAWTGAISATIIRETGATFTIVGHSERRQFFGETDQSVNKKIGAALSAGLRAIVCIGETLQERETGQTEAVLNRQLVNGLAGLTEPEFSPIIVAYEPVWAIGTGRTATPEIAQQAHCFIRGCVGQIVSPTVARGLRILYGGSVKPDNIRGLMEQPDIDGALVGGASLQAKSFASIVHYQVMEAAKF
ncbi:MAG: triose-phosphate isomerase [Acidobacteria bacterium]|nr:triose-phosphate isomerase [Acidobacteriota bacterium]